MVTDRQVRGLRSDLIAGKPLVTAAMRTDMDDKTARKYRDLARMPSELGDWPRTWRTREDPFEDAWAEVAEQFAANPGCKP